ncbi:MAG: FlgD immunoglobulin-like domain containing protein, partial [Armatimonadota bacterium]
SYVVFMQGNAQETLTHELSADGTGVHMISFPLIPLTRDLSELLGIPDDDLLVARWDPQSPAENKYAIWPRVDPVAPGRAYWLRVFSDLTLELAGVKLAENRPAETPLKVGWNQVGSPRLEPVDIESLEFEAGGESAVSYEEAVEQRIIQAGVLGYSQEDGYTERRQMVPFEGYWIRCKRADGAIMRFPVGGAEAALTRSATSPAADDLAWEMPIVAEAGRMSGAARLGAASDAREGPDAHDLQAPPGFGPRVEVTFDPEGTGASRYRTDVRPTAAPEQTYALKVHSTLAHRPVQLRWPDVSEVPEDTVLTLIDESADRRVYMRTSGGYELPATDEGVSRRLTIKAHRRSTQPLLVSGMSAMQATSGTAQVVFTLSSPADVQVEVLNIAGRTVRAPSIGPQQSGQNTLSWNLRDNAGTMVPSGMYLVRMNARDDTGRQTQALRPLQITR